MAQRFDILVIGPGPAGYHLALACRKAGRSVAVADAGPFGGTCGTKGCQPTKFLHDAASVAYLSRQMSGIGIDPPAQMHWPSLIQSLTAFASGVPERTERMFEKAGIEQFHDQARFISPEEVAIGQDTAITAEHFVIATGARPAKLAFPGGDLAVTTTEFLQLGNLPRRIVLIGGGCLSLEFAHIARAAGASVTIVLRGRRILKRFEEDLVSRVTESARAFGINIITGFEATMIEKSRGGLLVRGGASCGQVIEAELVLNVTGRCADLDHLGLEQGEITRSARGVEVNQYLQSVSNDRVYAIGYASATAQQLSTVAEMEGGVAAENILNGNRVLPDYQGIPSALFTLPPVAQVGLSEEKADQAGLSFRVRQESISSWPTSKHIGQQHAYYKILLEKQSGRVLGAHLFGHNSSEMINIFALAIKFGLTDQELGKVLWAYPTYVSDIKYMLEEQ